MWAAVLARELLDRLLFQLTSVLPGRGSLDRLVTHAHDNQSPLT
jgi:hypothetical protein